MISISTKNSDVANITKPINKALDAAAPTYPITISKKFTGADRTSYMVPIDFGKLIPNEAFETACVMTLNIINPGTMNAP